VENKEEKKEEEEEMNITILSLLSV